MSASRPAALHFELGVRIRSVRAIVLSAIMLGIQMVAYLAAVRVILSGLGTEGFGTFQLMRQVASFATPVLLVGINVALVQRLASAAADADAQCKAMFSGALVAIASWTALTLLRATDPVWLSGMLLSRREVDAAQSLVGLLAAVLIYTYAYAVYRGQQRFFVASALQTCCFGLLPLGIALAYAGTDVFRITDALALGTTLVALVALLPLAVGFIGRPAPIRGALKEELNAQWRYGVRRMFIPLLLGGMVAAGPIALTHAGFAKSAGEYLVALVVFRAVEPALTIIAVVMLPMLSRVSTYNPAGVREYGLLATDIALGVGSFLAVFGAVLAQWMAVTFFATPEVAVPLRYVLMGLPFSMYLLLAQPLIDATTSKGVVLIALSLAFVVNAVCAAAAITWAPHSTAIALSLTLGYISAALFIWRHISRAFAISFPSAELAKVLLANAALAIPAWLALSYGPESRWLGAVVAVLAPPSYWLVSRMMHARWCVEVELLLVSSLKPRGSAPEGAPAGHAS